MSGDAEQPITGLCIVANAEKCPPGYELIYRSKDRNDDCDLWKDSFFKTKVTRYLCYTRVFPLEGGRLNNVLVDISFINEREMPPPGYSLLEKTLDTSDTATKKKVLCVKMVPRSSTNDAISDLIILSRSRRPPQGYTFVGELNGLNLCSKMGPVPPESQNMSSFDQPSTPSMSYPPPRPSQPAPQQLSNHFNTQLSTGLVTNAVQDIPFVLSSQLQSNNADITAVPTFHMKTQDEIEREYQFDFRLARSVVGR